MSDRLNNELLSAYLDNEVTDEERAEVEQALVDSAETRVELESLKQVQARLRSVPRLTLAPNFHERVVREAERRSRENGAAVLKVRSAKWRRFATVAATVAAVLVVAFVVAITRREAENVGNPLPGGSGVASEGSSIPGNDGVASIPGEDVVAVAERVDQKLILVLDLAITKKGQRGNVFGNALKIANIPFNPRKEGVVLDSRYRSNLLKTRFVAGVHPPWVGKVNERFDIVDMVYIQGTGPQIDAFYRQVNNHPEVSALLDLAFKPKNVQVLNSIGDESWSLAKSEASGVPSSFAYRLNIRVALHSNRGGFLAKFPTPGFKIGVLEDEGKASSLISGFSLPIPMEIGGDRLQPGRGAGGNAANIAQVPKSEILVIRRNLTAGFPANAQKPDAK